MKTKSLNLAMNATRPLARAGLFLFAMLAAASQAAASGNLLTNGDFAQTYQPVLSSNPLPTGWTNLSGNTDNAGVWNGELLFSTAGNHVTTHRYFVYQQFDAGTGGTFDLTFDSVSLAAEVPEPASALLLVAGAAGLALRHRRARG